MIELVDTIYDLLKQGEDLVLARVISVEGSAPREEGAAMIIRKNGEIEGTVGGGLIEAGAMKKALALFNTRGWVTLQFDMTSNDVKTSDMVCGGKVELLVEFLPAIDETVRIFECIKENKRNSKTSYFVTRVPAPDDGAGSIQRWLLSDNFSCGAGEEDDGFREQVFSLTEPGLIELGGSRLWVDILRGSGVVYICGAGHVAREVSDLALHCGFMTIVMDDRSEYANAKRFNRPAEVVLLKSFENCFNGFHMDDNSYIVIVTRGHAYDKLVLEQAMKTSAGYIGMIGSSRKREAIYKALLSEGLSAGQLEKVHCPIGLEMEAETPAEIAVSVVGEMVDVRAQKRKNKINGVRLVQQKVSHLSI